MWLMSLTSAAALLSKTWRLSRLVREGRFHHLLLLDLIVQRPGESSVSISTFVSASCCTFYRSSEHLLYPQSSVDVSGVNVQKSATLT